MRYGYFDDVAREYVIDHVDTPVSWTNYIGVSKMCAVLSQVAGGYSFYRDAEHGRITKFRPNGVPMDWPGHWVYLRDDEEGDYWSVSWQPIGKPLNKAKYECRHGLSYSRYRAAYNGIEAEQLIFITCEDDVEIWDVRIKNTSERPRTISAFSYLEWSFHHIEIDNQNLQMSLYASGSSYAEGVIEYDFHYEPWTYHYHAASFWPDGFDSVRENWVGPYRTERNPVAVERGRCSGSEELTGNHCASLHKRIVLQPGEERRLIFLTGYGNRSVGLQKREKYSKLANVDAAFADLRHYWDEKCAVFQAKTPHPGLDTMANIWTLYQAETCVHWSRFASFIEVGGRTGLGYRDTGQDIMAVPHTSPAKVKERIGELLHGQVSAGYGLHLFNPDWFKPGEKPTFKSPTIAHAPAKSSYIHGLDHACSDDHLWLIPSICEYVKETGDTGFFDEVVPYADAGEATVWEHIKAGLDFSAKQVGPSGICLGLRADWNDCLNLGGGESAMVSFLHHWALLSFVEAAEHLGRRADAEEYRILADRVRAACERELWDGKWYARGTTASGLKIGTEANEEAKIFIESNTWAVLSGVAAPERAESAVAAMDELLYTPWGLHLLQPSFSKPNDEIGFMGRVYKGIKENGAIFSHPNPWAVIAAAKLGQGERALRFYDALLPYDQNDKIEIRQAEPYSYCQFIYGAEHKAHGRARHPWLTGSAGWNYTAVTKWILGVRPGFAALIIDPCIPPHWQGFSVARRWRDAVYRIEVRNPHGVCRGVAAITLNGLPAGPVVAQQAAGSINDVVVVMG
ncbi:MAG: N,N'-diacetylchitobiose phosphorylase [Alphaproteobacteria bacterium]|nr:N,N'-diacetylchitobiose phosphorylase [Alphaproteobacteria bacterium]